MRLFNALMICLAALCPAYAFADNSSPSALIKSGFDAYIKGSPEEAISAWIKGSGLEGKNQSFVQANALRQIESFYGKPESLEIIKENQISERSTQVLFVINLETGPIFARFQAYKTKAGAWVATEFRFMTEAALIFPDSMVYGK